MDLDTLRREALRLPPGDRARLASELLKSLDALPKEDAISCGLRKRRGGLRRSIPARWNWCVPTKSIVRRGPYCSFDKLRKALTLLYPRSLGQ